MANHIKTVIKFKNLKKPDIDLLLDLLAVPTYQQKIVAMR